MSSSTIAWTVAASMLTSGRLWSAAAASLSDSGCPRAKRLMRSAAAPSTRASRSSVSASAARQAAERKVAEQVAEGALPPRHRRLPAGQHDPHVRAQPRHEPPQEPRVEQPEDLVRVEDEDDRIAQALEAGGRVRRAADGAAGRARRARRGSRARSARSPGSPAGARSRRGRVPRRRTPARASTCRRPPARGRRRRAGRPRPAPGGGSPARARDRRARPTAPRPAAGR